MMARMDLPGLLAWLVDEASASPGPDRFLAELGGRLVADGLPLAGGALTLAVPHPLIAQRTWLWRADSGEVIEAFGFVAGGLATAGAASAPGDAGRRWLAELAAGVVHEDAIGSKPDGPSLGWIGPRPFTHREINELHDAARYADGGARGLSWPAQRGAAFGRPFASRYRRDHSGGAAFCRPARLHGAVGEQSALGGDLGSQCLVRPHCRTGPRLRRRSVEIHRRRW